MPLAKQTEWIGLAKEVTKGTWLTPVDYLPVTSIDCFDHIAYYDDKGIRGSMVDSYGLVAGAVYSEVSFSGDVFPESIPRVIYGLMGELATSGAGAPYTHKFTVLNTAPGQPPAFSVTHFNGFEARGYVGVQFSEIAFKFVADGLMTYTAKGIGLPSAVHAGPFTPTYNAQPPIADWNGTWQVSGTPNVKLESVDVTINRPVGPINNIDAVQGPYKIWVGPLKCTGKAMFVFEDNTDYNTYLNGTAISPSVYLTFQTGAAATTRTLQFIFDKMFYRDPTKTVMGKDYVELDVTWEGVANTTDVGVSAGYGPVIVNCLSAVSGYTT